MVAAARQLEVEAVQARTEALYREYRAHVARICRSLLRDRAEAEDATQQVFLSAHRALLGGAVPREPLAWLATIARRECWAHSSRAAGAAPTANNVADGSSRDVENVALRNAEVAALWLAIADLPRAQREALLLREIRGLSYLQLGEALAVSGPAARSLLARARRRVRLRLQDLHTAAGSVPLVETLARLIATGIDPAAPAARVAALGLVAGGAIIAPGALEHHVRRPVALSAPSQHRISKKISRPAVKVRVVAPHRVAATAPFRPVSVREPQHESHRMATRRHVEAHRRGRDDVAVVLTESSSGGGGRSGEGGETAAPPTTTATAPVISNSGHDSGSSGASGVIFDATGSGDSGGDSHGGGRSDEGSGSGSGGG